jgi:4-amino-4-deoxychorismate lyase
MSSESALRHGDGNGFSLIETMRWDPALGYVRLEYHLERLHRSAHELAFAYDPDAVREALRGSINPEGPMRVRLQLSNDGTIDLTTTPFEPLPVGRAWHIRLAEARLDSGDPLLRHKTTRRAIHDAARSEFPPKTVDEVILCNERGEVCEATITNVFVDPGGGEPWLTPAVACGLLPGVLRGELIDLGKVREAILTPGDLSSARAVYVGNSLRGLISARLD